MGLVQKLLNKLNRKRILKLNSSGFNISIDCLEEFLKGNKKIKLNQKTYKARNYKKQMHLYIMFLISKGVKLSKRELANAKRITGVDYKNNNGNDFGEKAFLLKLIRTHTLDKNYIETKEYKEGKLEVYNSETGVYYSIDAVNKAIINLRKQLNEPNMQEIILGNKEQQEINQVMLDIQRQKTMKGLKQVENRRKLPENATVNPEFEQLIIRQIKKKPLESTEELAFRIYNALNQNVEFNPGYFMGKDDEISKKFIERIMSKKISEVTSKNNRIVCKQWSELYAYFLRKYGIDSNIVSIGSELQNKEQIQGHSYVEVYTDNGIIKADATEGKISPIDQSNMPDLSRTRLGLAPVGFESPVILKKMKQKYEDGKDYKTPYAYPFKQDVIILMELIKKDKSFNFINTNERIAKGFEYIFSQINGTDLRGMALIDYLKNTFSRAIPLQENDKHRAGLSTSIYTKTEDNKYEYVPMLYRQIDENTYEYYPIINGKVVQMNNEEIEELVNQGEMHIIPGKAGHIPGIKFELKETPIERS